MFITVIRSLYKSATMWVLLATSATYGTYQVVKPTQPPLTGRQKDMIAELTDQVSDWASGLEPQRKPTAFFTFDRDQFSAVSEPVRNVLWQSDRFDLKDYTVKEKFYKKIEWTQPAATSRTDAAEMARDRECEQAIWGKVAEFSDSGGKARLAVEIELIDAASARPVMSKSFAIEKGDLVQGLQGGNPGRAADKGRSWSITTRLFVWVVATILLPFIIFPVTKAGLTSDSNAATLALLLGYVLASVATAYLLLLWAAAGWITGIMLLVTFGLAFLYYWHILTRIKRLYE